jgi:ABC-2 type transport system ATP-binding protein
MPETETELRGRPESSRRCGPEERIPDEHLPSRGSEERIPEHARPRPALVKAVGLTKRYLGTTVLNDVSFTLNAGEIFGLVGPNGAGKTTLLRILATLTPADSGSAEICGHGLQQVREVRSVIGFMPDVLGVYEDMLVREYLEFFARAHHLPEATREYSLQETMTIVGLTPLAQQPVDGLSRGMKQRLGLARAMLHNPKLLLLDEPASGLDPLARLELREILRRLQRKGTSVLISSHVLEDLADICNRVGIIKSGRLECVEETSKLIVEKGARRLRLRATERQEDLFEWLKVRADVDGLRWDNDCLTFRLRGGNEDDLARLLTEIITAGYPIVRFAEEQSTLESAYLNVTAADAGA